MSGEEQPERKSLGRRASDFLVKVAQKLSNLEDGGKKKKKLVAFDDYEYLGSTFPALVEERVAALSGVACNAHHALLLSSDGSVRGCGSNEYGQLGRISDGNERHIGAPTLLSLPCIKQRVAQVACGLHHSLCLLDNGNVVSFGQNEYGQLGLSKKNSETGPAVVQHIGREFVIQVECTYYSSLFLSRTGKVFAAGRGHYGVTGSGDLADKFLPVLVEGALAGNPVRRICTGSRHCIVVTVSGRVYGFGDNHKGQLGIDPSDTSEGISPVAVRMRIDSPVSSIGCGEWHSLFLTQSGSLYGCGSNSHGQLGMQRTYDAMAEGQEVVVPPQLIPFEEESPVVRIACGRKHSCILTEDGVVFGFGNGKDGQLGKDFIEGDVETPSRLSKSVSHVLAGGHSTFILRTSRMDIRTVASQLAFKDLYHVSPQQVKRYYEAVLQQRKAAQHTRKIANLCRNLFLTAYTLNASFLLTTPEESLSKTSTARVNLNDYLTTLQLIIECVQGEKGFRRLIAPLVAKLYQTASYASEPDQLRAYYLLMYAGATVMRMVPAEYDLFISAFYNLPRRSRNVLMQWIERDMCTDGLAFVGSLLGPLVDLIDSRYIEGRVWNAQFLLVGRFLRDLYVRCERSYEKNQVDFSHFYSRAAETIDDAILSRLYVRWRDAIRHDNSAVAESPPSGLFLYPFLLSAKVKRRIMQIEELESMTKHSLVNMWLNSDTFFVLEVRRENLLNDTIEKILRSKKADLKKPLRVKFAGEEGLDAGGVKKEFFQLLSAQLFSRDFDMFRPLGDTNLIWFNPYKAASSGLIAGNADDEVEFMLVGALIGLAIYNSTLLDVQFPITLYEMLLDRFPRKPGIADMRKLDPVVAQGLDEIMKAETNEELEQLGITFSITYEVLGEYRTVELLPQGSEMSVTLKNRRDYIRRFVKFHLVDSIREMKEALLKGFHLCIPPSLEVLDLFRPDELELALVGTPDLDFSALERKCEYEGFAPTHRVVRWFWKFVYDLDRPQQQALLKFCTGSPRAPVGGLGELSFKIQRAGPDSPRLPTASTCFNTLLLPEYGTEEKLRRLTLLAVENGEGFFLE